MQVPSTEGRPREASQGWGGTGTRGCGSQLHPRADPRSNPVGYYRAGLGPGTVERESGKSRWRAGQARIFFWRLLWRATPPHVWGNGKRDGQTPSPTKAGADETWLFGN